MFPQAYLELISKLRELSIPLGDVFEELSAPPYPDWPKHIIPFFADDMGNYYCFDASRAAGPNGPPVVFWDHEIGRDENIARFGMTDETFAEWATRYATTEISDRPARSISGKGCVILLCAAVILILSLAAVGATTVFRWIAASW